MARLAFEFGVLAFQLERGLLVRFTGEQRCLKAGFVVAGIAICARCASFKLPMMDIFMTVAANGVRDGRAKIVALVALRTIRRGVFPVKRKLGLVVVEAARW